MGGPLWLAASQRPEARIERQLFTFFPTTITQWQEAPKRLNPTIEKVLGASDHLVANYASTSRAEPGVNLLVSYYLSQNGEGGGIHSPEVCIPGAGWEVQKWESEEVPVATAPGGKMFLNRAIVQKSNFKQLVYYWFQQQGRTFTIDCGAKAICH